ncbi:hypothetical protein D037_3792A, partial [Vibrio parahaemolyticus IDH02640]
MRPHQ